MYYIRAKPVLCKGHVVHLEFVDLRRAPDHPLIYRYRIDGRLLYG